MADGVKEKKGFTQNKKRYRFQKKKKLRNMY